MEIEALIEGLSQAAAYPWQSADTPVEVIHTHISVVFLVGREVFKIHKPVDFGFLNFSSPEARRGDCRAEFEINQQLAPGIYRGVAGVVERAGSLELLRPHADGALALREGEEVVEWAVWMRRLPESATFRSLLERERLSRPHLWRLAAILVEFYRRGRGRARAHPELARLGGLAAVEANIQENFAQLDAMVDEARSVGRAAPIDPDIVARLQRVTDTELGRVRALIESRHERGLVRETHGDLRLDHIYDLGAGTEAELIDAGLLEAVEGRELLVIDRIEFNDRFRWSDPIADVAFLVMDLQARGAWQLARCFADDFIAASEDPEGAELMRLYTGYRATVRAKIAAMAAGSTEIPKRERERARERASARARLALVELSEARERPCLLLVVGLPGSGKSVLARALRETAGFTWIRADELRKRLAGMDPLSHEGPANLYSAEWTDRTYAACLSRAADVCEAGGRALVDATFIDGRRRAEFVAAATRWGVPAHMLEVYVPPKLARERIAARCDDPSDADLAVYEGARQRWSAIDPLLCPFNRISASGTRGELLADAARALTRAGLL